MAQDEWIYEFNHFRLHPAERRFLCESTPVPITPKAFEVLLILVRNCGHLVDKSTLVCDVWGKTHVEEGNLAVTISMLRKALGDDRGEHKFIETVSKKGYRFLAIVNKVRVVPPVADASLDGEELTGNSLLTPPNILITDAFIPKAKAPSRRIAWVAAFLVMGVIGGEGIHYRSNVFASRSLGRTVRSIAVLPFATQVSDATGSHIGMGIADDLITEFGTTDHIKVRPASAVMKYASGKVDLTAIADEQEVDALVIGSVKESGRQLHVTARLVSPSGITYWSGEFEKPLAQMTEVEEQIETQVVQALYPDRKPIGQRREASRDPEAYELYIEGRYFWNKRTEEGFRRSIECFQQAVLKDPEYADAYAGLADSYTLLASYGVEPEQEAYPNAKAAALKALQLDDSLAEAHTSLGMVALYYEWNWPKADREFRRAIELNPRYSLAQTWYALYFSAMGQPDQAIDDALRAQELDPVSLMSNTELGRVYYWNRKYDKAIATFRHALELDPYFARAHTRLGMALAAEKNYPDAIHEFQVASTLTGHDPYLDGLIGYSEAMDGNTKVAHQILTNLIDQSRHQFVPGFSVALVCIGLGDRNQAMDWLEKAYQDRSTYMVYAQSDPLLDSVRSDPRFANLMLLMGFQDGREAQIGVQVFPSERSHFVSHKGKSVATYDKSGSEAKPLWGWPHFGQPVNLF
jgi:DNA-binding winged helix-turn-helix (wHTH) protein/TolB-like protein/Tfp pilus assembly protein PilF